MNKIILLVILFNVVAAFVKSRNKRKREEAARRNGAIGNGGDTGLKGVGRGGESRSMRDGMVSTSTEEAASRVDEEEEGENPYREPAQAKPAAATRTKPATTMNPPRPADAGRGSKDLLSQLAKELGLRLPVPAEAAPQPAAKAAKPAAPVRAVYASRNTRATSRDDDNARTVADSAPGTDLTSAPGIAAVESANAEAYAARDPLRPTALTAIRADLFDPESLRRAFILKTVLDKPLSLKPHVPGYSVD